MADNAVYIAITSGSAEIKGETFTFQAGVTRVRAGHPLLKACPDYFQPDAGSVTYEVESASAAPGEKRGAQ
jgi:hypothetical protein